MTRIRGVLSLLVLLLLLPVLAQASEITITAPSNGATVSDTVTVSLSLASNVWWTQLFIDGAAVTSGYNPLTWNSAGYAAGQHRLRVNAYLKGGSTPIGMAIIAVRIGTSPSPTPTATATPTPTPVGHYSLLPPGAALPSEADCVAQVDANPIPEYDPWNADDGSPERFDSLLPPAGGLPPYFDAYATFPDGVDGNFTGSTDMVERIIACKWGIDEDLVRAQSWQESYAHEDCAVMHGGSGCNEQGDCNNPAGDLFVGTGTGDPYIDASGYFTGINGIDIPDGSCLTGQWDSWGAWQTKVYYEWWVWPEIAESMPFAGDYLYGYERACINGDLQSYFSSQGSAEGADYQNAVGMAESDPSGITTEWPGYQLTNDELVEYGCAASHYYGSWQGASGSFDDYAGYGADLMTWAATAPWPGGLK